MNATMQLQDEPFYVVTFSSSAVKTAEFNLSNCSGAVEDQRFLIDDRRTPTPG